MEDIAARPARARSFYTWFASGALLGLVVLTLGLKALGWKEMVAPTIVWTVWYGISSFLVWVHLGMVRTPAGVPLDKLNWPNGLTYLRLGLAPLVWKPVLAATSHSVAPYLIAFLAFLALTDILDGLLARLLKLKTVLGRSIDPGADLVFLVALAVGLHSQQLVTGLLLGLVLFRYIGALVGLMMFFFLSDPAPVQATYIGKVTSFSTNLLLTLAVVLMLIHPAWLVEPQLGWANTYLTILISINIAYFFYWARVRGATSKRRRESSPQR